MVACFRAPTRATAPDDCGRPTGQETTAVRAHAQAIRTALGPASRRPRDPRLPDLHDRPDAGVADLQPDRLDDRWAGPLHRCWQLRPTRPRPAVLEVAERNHLLHPR